ncbi:TatD family hydrolase [Parabacteroides sp. ASD2025]|uniref:TatD family hydrolase n=1 Tax=Parabacteroides sp. ASD2025 TaxID=3415987 RepID=UPI003CF97586
MVYYDIHTHHLPVHPEDIAIVNCLASPSNAGTGLFHSVGIHPWYIHNEEEQLAELKRQAMLPGVVAIGETGLDKLAEASLERQQEIFKASAAFAENLGIFLIIHCVKAWDELIALKKELKPRMPWVIHGFRGNAALAKQLIRQGFYLSFGEHFNSEALREAWPDYLFAETDDRKIDIRTVYQNLSTSLNLPLESFAAQVVTNVQSTLHLP